MEKERKGRKDARRRMKEVGRRDREGREGRVVRVYYGYNCVYMPELFSSVTHLGEAQGRTGLELLS